jgi:hypothetical protein
MKRLALVLALTMGPVAVVSPVEASKPWLCPKYTHRLKRRFRVKIGAQWTESCGENPSAKHVQSAGTTAPV